MSTTILNEHDANQGAQSKGEFLGMTGNSGWYLLGAAGSTVLMVIVLWGIFEVSLVLCVLVGVVLCVLSVVYVFTLKNNKPEHYDTDFFEAALIEAGLIEIPFGPRERRPDNPFQRVGGDETDPALPRTPRKEAARPASGSATRIHSTGLPVVPVTPPANSTADAKRDAKARADDSEPTVPLRTYEKLQSELEITQEHLADALAEREED